MDGIIRKIGMILLGHQDDIDNDDYINDNSSYDDGYEDYDDYDNGDTVEDNSNVSFCHAPNDGSYTKTNKDVNIQVAGGNNKGPYDVFLHHGQKYIDFQNQWINIEGKTRFSLNGNSYIIK